MEHLLPPLSGEQFSSLESDILENGCYAPMIVNEDMILIDGHNRFRICEKHSLPYKMLVFSFADLLEAKQWALDTQKGRRNLDKWELGKIALKLKPEIEARARANMAAGGGNHKSERTKSGLVNSPNPILFFRFYDCRLLRPCLPSLWPQFPVSVSMRSYLIPTCPGCGGLFVYPVPIASLQANRQMKTPAFCRADCVFRRCGNDCARQ